MVLKNYSLFREAYEYTHTHTQKHTAVSVDPIKNIESSKNLPISDLYQRLKLMTDTFAVIIYPGLFLTLVGFV